MKSKSDFAGGQIRGTRANQEDFYAFREVSSEADGLHGVLIVLADGMGAYTGGAVASRTVVESFQEGFCRARGPVATRLLAAMRASERGLSAEIERREKKFAAMGATLVAAFWQPHEMQWISVGDSVLYLYRQGRLKRLNADHSMAPLLDAQVANGEMTFEEAACHPTRHHLRTAIINQRVTLYELRREPYLIGKDDLIFAASDGIGSLPDSEIEALLAKCASLSAAAIAKRLLRAVEEKKRLRQDNVTLAVIHAARPRPKKAPTGSLSRGARPAVRAA